MQFMLGAELITPECCAHTHTHPKTYTVPHTSPLQMFHLHINPRKTHYHIRFAALL